MTDLQALLSAYDEQTRARIPAVPARGVTYEYDGALLRETGRFRGFVETPRDAGVRGPALDALIARQRDHFAARGQAVEWKTRAHDRPADLPRRLLAAGFVPEERESVLVGLAARLAGDAAPPPGVTVRQVSADADLRRITAMKSVVWGRDLSSLADELGAQLATAPHDVTVLVAEAGGEVVCAAWLVVLPGTQFAGLWGGSTAEAWRGRGIYRALVAERARRAVSRGVPYLQVDATEDSRPILERLGMRAITTTTPYVWTPGR